MKPGRLTLWQRLPALFEILAPDPARARHRIVLMERNVMLPVKIFFIAVVLQSFDYSPWIGQITFTPDVAVETVQIAFLVYMGFCAVLFLPAIFSHRLPLALLQWSAVTSALVDAIMLAGMVLVTGGLDSILFWLFVGLILRNAISIPAGFSQLVVNFVTSLCYLLAVIMEFSISANLDEFSRRSLDFTPRDDWGQPLILRLFVLALMTITSYGVQAFLERQRLAAEEADEFAARENQLHAAGRLAAEFAHQIKNPLAVINNAAFSLQRSLRENKNGADGQIEIIREEVSRADRVITQIMGYAQLSEGRVEKLNLVEELDRAITQVFPPAVPSEIKLHQNIMPPFPPLLMQRGHLTEILINLLLNAREILDGKGNVFATAICNRNQTVEISIADDGPGVAPEKIGKIFEAYYTTKERGTGLGLAIVKHNAELYGGTVRVESELGKGAVFTVSFPAKALSKSVFK